MVVIPAVADVTKPKGSMVATEALLLAHAPPGVLLANCEVLPRQIVVVPVMAGTTGFPLFTTVRAFDG
jgi:hypothetical protein